MKSTAHANHKNLIPEKSLESLERVNIDKRAEILQDTFRHYYSMAMDHHTKAGTTSNMLLIIVGAIISLFGLDNTGSGTPRLVGGLAVFVIGLFGVVWVLKQHERYHFWEHIAYEYQKELTNIVPALNIGSTYFDSAREATTKEFGAFFAKMYERYLWVALHSMVALIGLSLIVFAI